MIEILYNFIELFENQVPKTPEIDDTKLQNELIFKQAELNNIRDEYFNFKLDTNADLIVLAPHETIDSISDSYLGKTIGIFFQLNLVYYQTKLKLGKDNRKVFHSKKVLRIFMPQFKKSQSEDDMVETFEVFSVKDG